jgi:release factor glutamine methyltransferase
MPDASMLTVLEVIQRTTGFLDQRGIPSPRLNAELLVGHVLGLPRMQLYVQFERPLGETELAALRPLVRRRSNHEPLQYILGTASFHGLVLKVDRRALIPRPETELLVESVIKEVEGRSPPARILDLGCGTGAIALALATRFKDAHVTAVDESEAALELAGENVESTGLGARVRLLRSDWFSALDASEVFDLIVANPPYLTEEELATAAPEVRDHEPRTALVPGDTAGISALTAILQDAPKRMNPGGLLALETGTQQHAALVAEAERLGLVSVRSLRDLAGRDRFVLASRP